MANNPATQIPPKSSISADEVLRIARLDAEKSYRDLTQYRVCVALFDDGWHVDYELKDSSAQGGGPHYVIDFAGKIKNKKYQQ